jgi:hypothetical protein
MLMPKPLALWAAVLVVLVGSHPARSGPIPGMDAISDSDAKKEGRESPFDPASLLREGSHFTHLATHSHETVRETASSSLPARSANNRLYTGIPLADRVPGNPLAAELPAGPKCAGAASSLGEMESVARTAGEFGAGSRALTGCSRVTCGGAAFVSEAGAAGATVSRGMVGITESLGELGRVGAVGAAGAAGAAAAAAAKKRRE